MVTVEQDLVRSAVLARDVIESYRRSHVALSGWDPMLREAAASFMQISAQYPVIADSIVLAELARDLDATVSAGLHVDQATLDALSKTLRSIVTTTRVPGIPRPEDLNWSF